nr:unnamed protein product [Callosobruchus chinensis]
MHIIQWNARSIVANRASLQHFLSNNLTHFVAVSETWLNTSHTFTLKGFNFVKKCRNDGSGGVGIFIKEGINFSELNISNNFNPGIEVCAITTNNGNLNIASIYKPPDIRVSQRDWCNLFSQFTSPTIFCGDFNSHHGLWGYDEDDAQGKMLVEAMEIHNLIILNDGRSTRVVGPQCRNKFSAVDLTLVSPILADKVIWDVLEDTMGSDHFPIQISAQFCGKPTEYTPYTRWNEKGADWSLFQNLIELEIEGLLDIDNRSNPDKFETVIRIISDAANNSMPLKKPFICNSPQPVWWDEECSNFFQLRKRALNRYRLQASLENFITYKKTSAQVKKLFKQKQRSSWLSFLTKLNRRTPIKDIWKFVKSINRKALNTKSPIPEDLIEQFLDKLAPLSASSPPIVNSQNFVPQEQSLLGKPFDFSELQMCLKDCKNSSPGIDRFTYQMLHNLPKSIKMILLQIINDWWTKHNFVDQFKTIITCLIPKPGRKSGLIDSYRPISLLSCVTKTFERMIKLRLEFHVESNKLLPISQYGFRRGQGSLEAVTHLVLDIQLCFSKNEYLLCWFLDFKSAYDTVDLRLLMEKLIRNGISKKSSASIIELFTNRKMYIRDHKNELHGPRILYNGLPQGSILSPILFNLYTADFHDIFDRQVQIIQYADDICVYFSHHLFQHCLQLLGHVVEKVKNWLAEVNLQLAIEKSAMMCFTRHRIALPSLYEVGGLSIPVVQHYKYLGIILDGKLLWSKHIQYIKNKAEKGINILKCTTKKKWGSDPKIAKIFYSAYVRSVLDYGCVLYGSAAKTHLTKIDRVQYQALRICMGVMKSSPCPAILAEVREPPLTIRRQLFAERAVVKYRTYNEFLLNKISALTIEDCTNKYWTKKCSPMLVDAFINTNHLANYINPMDKYPLYNCPYDVFLIQTAVITPTYTENMDYNRSVLLAILADLESQMVIYTDGSKSEMGTGCAFYIPQINYCSSYRIPNLCSTFTAEAFAILRAIAWCWHQNITCATIVTDSKSVLEAIKNNPSKSYNNFLLCKIRNLLVDCQAQNTNIKFVWVKGHAGIGGNEIVDRAAKEAVNLNNITEVPVFLDFFIEIKKTVRKRWDLIWSDFVSKSHNHYTLLHPSLPQNIPHIDNFYSNREYSTIITRLKLNHGCFPAHLHRIGVIDSPFCSCDNNSIADLNHIFFACRLHTIITDRFIYEMIQYGFQLPLNITTILFSFDRVVYNAIIKFLKTAKINI